jgi:hypothetical protein
MPLDLLGYSKVQELIEEYGDTGLGVLCRLFIKLAEAQKDLYMIRVSEVWYKKFALDGNSNKIKRYKQVINRMVEFRHT